MGANEILIKAQADAQALQEKIEEIYAQAYLDSGEDVEVTLTSNGDGTWEEAWA